MKKITKVEYLHDYLLLITFNNGEKRIYNRYDFGFKGVWSYIEDLENFKKVTLVNGALTWVRPDGVEIDVCPDYTYMVSKPLN